MKTSSTYPRSIKNDHTFADSLFKNNRSLLERINPNVLYNISWALYNIAGSERPQCSSSCFKMSDSLLRVIFSFLPPNIKNIDNKLSEFFKIINYRFKEPFITMYLTIDLTHRFCKSTGRASNLCISVSVGALNLIISKWDALDISI